MTTNCGNANYASGFWFEAIDWNEGAESSFSVAPAILMNVSIPPTDWWYFEKSDDVIN